MSLRPPNEVLKQAEQEQAQRGETMRRIRRMDEAAQATGLSGDLRRAIRAAGLWPDEVASGSGIDLPRLIDFLSDDGPLSNAEIDRLAAFLELHLVPAAGEG